MEYRDSQPQHLESKTRIERDKRYTVLFLLGAGHSGSTLLNLLLNAHTSAIGLCEVHTIQRYLHLPLGDVRNPLSSAFWQEVAKCWSRKTTVSFHEIDLRTPRLRELRKWGAEGRHRYQEQNRALFDCVARISGAQVIVDSSHNRRRLSELDRSGMVDLRVIHLMRDGRALVNSYSKKYGSLWIGFRRWFVPTITGLLLRPYIRAPWLTVRYEDLASDPDEALHGICRFAGIKYEPSMLRYWEQEDLSVGGNRMRWRKGPVKFDEHWRNELSRSRKLLFAVVGGWLNFICGYPTVGARRVKNSRGHESR